MFLVLGYSGLRCHEQPCACFLVPQERASPELIVYPLLQIGKLKYRGLRGHSSKKGRFPMLNLGPLDSRVYVLRFDFVPSSWVLRGAGLQSRWSPGRVLTLLNVPMSVGKKGEGAIKAVPSKYSLPLPFISRSSAPDPTY